MACHSKNKFLNGGDFKKREQRRNPNPLVIFWSLILRSECSFPGQADIPGGTPRSLRTMRPGCRALEGCVGCTSPCSFVHCPTAASYSPLEKVGAYHKSRVSAARMLSDAQSPCLRVFRAVPWDALKPKRWHNLHLPQCSHRASPRLFYTQTY